MSLSIARNEDFEEDLLSHPPLDFVHPTNVHPNGRPVPVEEPLMLGRMDNIPVLTSSKPTVNPDEWNDYGVEVAEGDRILLPPTCLHTDDSEEEDQGIDVRAPSRAPRIFGEAYANRQDTVLGSDPVDEHLLDSDDERYEALGIRHNRPRNYHNLASFDQLMGIANSDAEFHVSLRILATGLMIELPTVTGRQNLRLITIMRRIHCSFGPGFSWIGLQSIQVRDRNNTEHVTMGILEQNPEAQEAWWQRIVRDLGMLNRDRPGRAERIYMAFSW